MELWIGYSLLACLFSVANNFIVSKLIREGMSSHETILFALPF